MKIALAQMKMSESMDENFMLSLVQMENAKKKGAEIICFPELQLTHFFPQYKAVNAKPFALYQNHPLFHDFCKKCRELNIVAIPNFYWEENDNFYDASIVINADGIVGGVSKMVHIADFPCFHEQDYYTASDTGFKVYYTPHGVIGIVICFDRHFSESIRSCVLQGADIIIIPTANTIGEPLEMFEWEIRVPAMQNSVFIAMCNRVGKEGGMHFSGRSLVVNEDGNIMARAGENEELLIVDIDIKQAKKRRSELPYLNLWRKDLFF